MTETFAWKVRGDAMWGKGLSEFNENIRSYLSKWSVDGILAEDTVSEAVDPMGNFPVAKQFWKVADYIGGSMTEAKTKQMDMRVVDSCRGWDTISGASTRVRRRR